jgi:hypothetical protein
MAKQIFGQQNGGNICSKVNNGKRNGGNICTKTKQWKRKEGIFVVKLCNGTSGLSGG